MREQYSLVRLVMLSIGVAACAAQAPIGDDTYSEPLDEAEVEVEPSATSAASSANEIANADGSPSAPVQEETYLPNAESAEAELQTPEARIFGVGTRCSPSACRNGGNCVDRWQCEPLASGWGPWSCGTDCKRKTTYNACPATACTNGEFCFGGFCTKACNGNTNNCPATPAGSGSRRLCMRERNDTAYDICAAAYCRTRADCAPGLGCYTYSDGFSFCAQCSGTNCK